MLARSVARNSILVCVLLIQLRTKNQNYVDEYRHWIIHRLTPLPMDTPAAHTINASFKHPRPQPPPIPSPPSPPQAAHTTTAPPSPSPPSSHPHTPSQAQTTPHYHSIPLPASSTDPASHARDHAPPACRRARVLLWPAPGPVRAAEVDQAASR